MVPLSLGRAGASAGGGKPVSFAWLRPANIAAARSAETRALITWLRRFVALAVAIALGHVWLRLQVTDLGYRISATRHVIEKLDAEGHELALDAARLDAPTRLEEVARTRLGMRPARVGEEAALP